MLEVSQQVLEWSLQATLLLFQPHLDHLYLVNGDEVRFNYDWGFKGEVQAELPNYCLNVALSWSSFQTGGNTHLKGAFHPPSVILNPSTTSSSNNSLHANYTLFFNEADLLFSKRLCFYPNILVLPKVGLGAVKIKHKFFTHFKDPPFHTDQALRFEGVGTKGGLETHWFFAPTFDLFGAFYGALYYGRFDLHQRGTEYEVTLDSHNRIDEVCFGSTLNLGIETHLSSNCRLTFSWEGHWFPSQNLFSPFTTIGSLDGEFNNKGMGQPLYGDFTLSGFALNLNVCF